PAEPPRCRRCSSQPAPGLASHPARAAGSEGFAHQKAGGETGAETQQGASRDFTGSPRERAHDSALHRVNLIPRSPQHPGKLMRRLPLARLILLGLLILAGLGLFLALAHRTPVVVQPAGTESRP